MSNQRPSAVTDETIAAVLSPPGVGGIAVIQVVGAGALEHTRKFLKNRASQLSPALQDNQLKLARWMDGAEHVDDVIVVAKQLRQGRQKVCITSHGSVRVVERILMCLQAAGVRIEPALPTEAIWEGLSPIEVAVMEHLPRAQTKRVAGWLTAQIAGLRDVIETVMRLLQEGQADAGLEKLRSLEQTFNRSRLLLEGATVVIVGPPNVGKSTLANRLFDRPWSIESPESGTTRDWVGQSIAIEGIPIILADTAGLREDADPLEMQAIEQARPIIRSADAQILVLDVSQSCDMLRRDWPDGLLDRSKLVVALNKSDLGVCEKVLLDVSKHLGVPPTILCALRGEGLDSLRQAILRKLIGPNECLSSSCIWDDAQLRTLRTVVALAREDPGRAATLLGDSFLGLSDKK